MKTTFAFFSLTCCLFLAVPESRAASCTADPTNLIANCGFETGTFSSWTLSGNDVPALLNNLYGVEGVDPIDGIAPHSGSSQAYFADLASNPTTLSQTVSTVVGKGYEISFYLAQDTLGTTAYPNAFSVSLNGVTLGSATNLPVSGYTQYTAFFIAKSTSSVIGLTAGNSLGEFLLDDVDVNVAPEPAALPLTLGGVLTLAAAYFSRRT